MKLFFVIVEKCSVDDFWLSNFSLLSWCPMRLTENYSRKNYVTEPLSSELTLPVSGLKRRFWIPTSNLIPNDPPNLIIWKLYKLGMIHIFIKTWLNAFLLFYFSSEEPETTKRCCPCKKHGPVGGYGYKPKYGYKPQNGYYQPQNDYYQPPQYGLVSNYGAPQYDYGLVSNYGTPQYGGDYSYGKHIYFIK